MYLTLKLVHVVLAILAVGANATYGIWIARARREPAHLEHVLRGVKILDDRVANPAYVLLLLTGLGMVWVGELSLRTFWIGTALGLYIVLALTGMLVYTPALRRQIELLAEEGPEGPGFLRVSRRATLVGVASSVLVLVIVYLMVVKPS